MLRPGRRHLAARVLRQHARLDRRQHGALSGDESRHGPPDSRDRGGVRLRPGDAQIEQAALAVLRRVECVVPRAFRTGHRRPPRRRAETARGGLQPRGRAARRRVRQHAAPERRARPRRLPRAARQRHRAARHERCRRAPAEHLLPVRVGLAVRARPGARPAGGIADLSDRRRRAAGRLRPQRTGAVRGRGRDARSAERPGVCADAESRSGRRAGAPARMARRNPHARADLRDTDRTGPAGIQYLRAASPRPARASRCASARRADDVQAARPVIYSRPPRDYSPGLTARSRRHTPLRDQRLILIVCVSVRYCRA